MDGVGIRNGMEGIMSSQNITTMEIQIPDE
jgi:hypothetical protein